MLFGILQVPEGFSAADLGGDMYATSEKTARLSAAQLCATRFLALRAEVNRCIHGN